MSPTSDLPRLIAHADWSTTPGKRWIAVARRQDTQYVLEPPQPATEPRDLIARLRDRAQCGTMVIGFDFPIGLPIAYAQRAGINDFVQALAEFGRGEWDQFFDLAAHRDQISTRRPFYPHGTTGVRRDHLLQALELTDPQQLYRRCERRTEHRREGCPLFWTLGGNQVGRAAIAGWRDILQPALKDRDVAIWPFQTPTRAAPRTIVESYPADACVQLGLTAPGRGWSKREHQDRRTQFELAIGTVERHHPEIRLDRGVLDQGRDGFGADSCGEDRFDAVIGLLAMITTVLRTGGVLKAPADPVVRRVEGWIVGQSF